METEEDRPLPRDDGGIPRNLERLSVDALKQYLVELAGERERVEAEIKRREGVHAAAENVFRR